MSEFGIALSADGGEVFYGVDLGHRAEIRLRRRVGGAWTTPEPFLADDRHSYNDPFLTPDGGRLYFISDRPHPDRVGAPGRDDTDLWFVERDPRTLRHPSIREWSPPRRLPEPVNSPHQEFYVSLSDAGELVFSSDRGSAGDGPPDFDLYLAEPQGDGFKDPVPLEALNSRAYQGDPFIARDGSFLLYSTFRRPGFGGADLYVAHRTADGAWGAPVNLGPTVNSAGKEFCPAVSADGTRLLFTRDDRILEVSLAAVPALTAPAEASPRRPPAG